MCPSSHEVKGPLVVAAKEDASAEANPALLLEEKVGPAMEDEVVITVVMKKELEVHADKRSVGDNLPNLVRL